GPRVLRGYATSPGARSTLPPAPAAPPPRRALRELRRRGDRASQCVRPGAGWLRDRGPPCHPRSGAGASRDRPGRRNPGRPTRRRGSVARRSGDGRRGAGRRGRGARRMSWSRELARARAVAWKDLTTELRTKANFNAVVFLAGLILL